MALEYFPFYHSYKKKTEKLTDQELGRLVRALVTYSETGEEQELTGRESIAFDFIAVDIKNAQEAYEEKCSRNKANRSGSSTTDDDRQRPSTTVDDRDQNKTKTKTKEETKNKPKDITEVSSPPTPSPAKPATATALAEEATQGWSKELRQAVMDWLTYKKQKRQSYQEVGLKSLLTQIRKAADEHGDAAVVETIRNSMASGYVGITLDRLQGQSGRRAKSPNMITAADYETMQKRPEVLAEQQANIERLKRLLDEDKI